MNYNSSQLRLSTVLLLLGSLLFLAAPIAYAADSSLAPIRIAPERRQLIGLKFAVVVRKDVSDRLETTGSTETDERRQGYVQTRSPDGSNRCSPIRLISTSAAASRCSRS